MPILSSFPDCIGGAGSADELEEITEKVSDLEEAVASKIENSPGVITTEHFAEGALSTVYQATIGTEWVGEEAPYTQVVSVPGFTSNDRPVVGVLYSDDYTTAMAERSAWACIYRIVIDDNSFIAYSTGVTEVPINLQLTVSHGQADANGESGLGQTLADRVLAIEEDYLKMADKIELSNTITAVSSGAKTYTDEKDRAMDARVKVLEETDIFICKPGMYGNDDLSTKAGVEGQLYFKVVE